MSASFRLACPSCKNPLVQLSADEARCPVDGGVYTREDGIWRFLTAQKRLEYWQFIQEYEAVRLAEGRGSSEAAYYRELPFRDRSGRFSADWKVRAISYQALISRVVLPLELRLKRPLKILDLGAGNGWLSNRLALRGHTSAAVDLQTNPMDGLGAYYQYATTFLPVQADFLHLPFFEDQVDLAIFNASFHYATSYQNCLCECLRVLNPDGQIVILDSPIYHDPHSGDAMVREREEHFRLHYGFASNAIPSENYLTYSRLQELSKQIGLEWKLLSVFYGIGWALRPLRARLMGGREPAQFRIAVGLRAPK